jgi:hypothetical protein
MANSANHISNQVKYLLPPPGTTTYYSDHNKKLYPPHDYRTTIDYYIDDRCTRPRLLCSPNEGDNPDLPPYAITAPVSTSRQHLQKACLLGLTRPVRLLLCFCRRRLGSPYCFALYLRSVRAGGPFRDPLDLRPECFLWSCSMTGGMAGEEETGGGEKAWCIIGWDWREGRKGRGGQAEVGLHVLTKYPKAHRFSLRYCLRRFWGKLSIALGPFCNYSLYCT